MDTSGFLIMGISILAGVSATIFVSYHFYYRGKFERLDGEHRSEMEKLKVEHKKQIENMKTPVSVDLQSRIHLTRVRDTFLKKFDSISKGNIELDILETSAVWSQMFRERNMIYLRATSLISPEIWDDEFMRKYQGEQRKLVDHLERLKKGSPSEYERIVQEIKSDWSSEIAEFNNFEINFERAFVLRSEQVTHSAVLKKLAETISSQSAYMDTRVIYENKVPPDDMKDFAIAISKEGDILVYELNIIGDILYGGRISYQPERISEAIDRYNRIVAQSTYIPKNSTYGEIVDIINKIVKASGTTIEQEVIEEAKREIGVHKCLLCFLSTEILMDVMHEEDWQRFPLDAKNLCEKSAKQHKGSDWTRFQPDEKRWYQMIDIENNTILGYVIQNKPKRIIEVGCGPGRLISQILKIKDYEYDEIVGIDGDEQMYDIAYHRFPPTEYPNVDILNMKVKKKLPYPVDHFHLCINAMNIVGWQENEVEWLKEMLRCSYTAFFTLYKRDHEEERAEMYRKRPHRHNGVLIDETTGQVRLIDCATNPGVISKAYKHEDVDRICKEVVKIYEPEYQVECDIDGKSNDLLYLCSIHKTKK